MSVIFRIFCEKILEDYTFPKKISTGSSRLQERIENTESVSIHIRRGDYLDAANYKIYGNICTVEYYQNAISRMCKLCESPEFYLFSNDPEWAKKIFGDTEGITIVEEDKERPDYEDMFLMSRCKHNIIANSSFSWWAAWLIKMKTKR